MSEGDVDIAQRPKQAESTTTTAESAPAQEDDRPRTRFAGAQGFPIPPVSSSYAAAPGPTASDLAYGDHTAPVAGGYSQTDGRTGDIQDQLPTFGKAQPAASAPITGHLTSHTSAHPAQRPPDEVELDWSYYVTPQPVSDPFVPLLIVPGAKPPKAPGAQVEGCESAPNRADGPTFPSAAEPEVSIDAFHLAERTAWWDAYRQVALGVDAVQQDVAPDVNQFFHAERDPTLRALGVFQSAPEDLASSVEAQQVPKRGGTRIGSMFAGDQLAIGAQDQHAIDSAGRALQQGRGDAEDAFLGTEAADSDLHAAVFGVKRAVDGIAASEARVRTMLDKKQKEEAARDAAVIEGKIAERKGDAEATRTLAEDVFAIPAKLAPLLTGVGEVGAGMEAIGAIANGVVDALGDVGLDELEADLADAHAREDAAVDSELQDGLTGARATLRGAVDQLAQARSKLRTRLTLRRKAYNHAGIAASQVAIGGDTSKQKIAAIISAIPLVEAVVANLRAIADKTGAPLPAYSAEAGFGFGMAMYAQAPEAMSLPAAIGRIQQAHLTFGTYAGEWQRRLEGLVAVKDRIAGARPKGDPA